MRLVDHELDQWKDAGDGLNARVHIALNYQIGARQIAGKYQVSRVDEATEKV